MMFCLSALVHDDLKRCDRCRIQKRFACNDCQIDMSFFDINTSSQLVLVCNPPAFTTLCFLIGLQMDDLIIAVGATRMRWPKDQAPQSEATGGSMTQDMKLMEFAFRMGQGSIQPSVAQLA